MLKRHVWRDVICSVFLQDIFVQVICDGFFTGYICSEYRCEMG